MPGGKAEERAKQARGSEDEFGYEALMSFRLDFCPLTDGMELQCNRAEPKCLQAGKINKRRFI